MALPSGHNICEKACIMTVISYTNVALPCKCGPLMSYLIILPFAEDSDIIPLRAGRYIKSQNLYSTITRIKPNSAVKMCI